MTIEDWVHDSHGTSVDKGWWGGVKDNPEKLLSTIPEKLMLIVTEVAEAMEEYRVAEGTAEEALEELRQLRFDDKGKPVGFPSELADVLIRCFDLAGVLYTPIREALEAKAAYNKTRKHRHGGKRA